jgi:hypothetical protein
VAGSAEGESNPWPAFVDVLTTVIMVVTFMLVIMSAAIVTLSSRVIAEAREVHEKAAKLDNGEATGGASAAISNADSSAVMSPKEAMDGQSIAERGSILRQEDIIDGDRRLTIRTRKVDESQRIKVAAMERAEESTGVEVQSADVLLTIDFEPDAVRYTKEAEGEVLDFSGRLASGSEAFEIWSFAPQTSSISEAERTAFYRAVLTRNLLIKAGVAPARLSTQVRVIDPSQGGHQVRVVVKP